MDENGKFNKNQKVRASMNNTNGKLDSVIQQLNKPCNLAINNLNKKSELEKIQTEAVTTPSEISGFDSKIKDEIRKTSSQQIRVELSSDKPNVSIQDDMNDKILTVLNEMPSNDNKSTKRSRANQKDVKELSSSYHTITIHGTKFYDDESNRQDHRGNQREPVLRRLITLIPPRKFIVTY